MRRRQDFLRIASARQKWAMPGLILQARMRSDAPTVGGKNAVQSADAIRVGYTASRKVGNAVMRNRAKRRLRAVAADILTSEGQPGMDYVLIGRRGTLDRPYDDLLDDLETAVNELDRRAKRSRQAESRI